MPELIQKRTYTQKHFDNGDGTFTMEAHGGHIHYFDKLDSGRFRGIDHTLSFDDVRRGWFFNYHSFRPFLPEYADGWVEFRDLYHGKDQTIRYKAKCDHVLGRLVDKVEGLTDINAVIYDDAFGKGYDLILYFTNNSLKKVVRIRDEFKKTDADLTFDFQIEFPKENLAEVDVYRAEKKEDISVLTASAYKLDTTKDKVFDTAKQLLVGNEKNDGQEWYTYIRTFKAWDSTFNSEERIDAKLYLENGSQFLQKIVSADFLSRSTGDVFTDTTTNYNAGTGDGIVGNSGNPWLTIRGAGTGNDSNTSLTYLNLQGDRYINPDYYIYRVFLPFDTSGLDDTVTVSDATLHIFKDDDNNSGTTQSVVIVPASQASGTALATSDFDAISFTNIGEFVVDYGDASGTEYTEAISSPATYVSLTDYTKLALLEKDHDFANDPATGNRYFLFKSANAASSKPYLAVTYSAGGNSSSVSPSYSPSASVSPSSSVSPSQSPSLSPSSSQSPSRSPSSSVSPSVSPSSSQSPSRSPSSSVSPSKSPSSSVSPSTSPSPSAGYSVHSRGDYASPPTTAADLETVYSGAEETAVSTDDDSRVSQSANTQYAIHQFRVQAGVATKLTINWNGQTDFSPATSNVILRLYNTSTGWAAPLSIYDTATVNTDFSFRVGVASLTNYKDGNNVFTCQVYQNMSTGTGTLQTDQFSVTLGEIPSNSPSVSPSLSPSSSVSPSRSPSSSVSPSYSPSSSQSPSRSPSVSPSVSPSSSQSPSRSPSSSISPSVSPSSSLSPSSSNSPSVSPSVELGSPSNSPSQSPSVSPSSSASPSISPSYSPSSSLSPSISSSYSPSSSQSPSVSPSIAPDIWDEVEKSATPTWTGVTKNTASWTDTTKNTSLWTDINKS